MSQQQLSELFRAANKLSYEIDGQINEIHCGKYLSSQNNTNVKTQVGPVIQSKIARINE